MRLCKFIMSLPTLQVAGKVIRGLLLATPASVSHLSMLRTTISAQASPHASVRVPSPAGVTNKAKGASFAHLWGRPTCSA